MKEIWKLTAMIAVSAAAACSAPDITKMTDTEEKTPLSISLATSSKDTRSMISGDFLPDGSRIGITLTEPQETTYDGITYSNVRFTSHGETEEQIWEPEADVMLSSSMAELHAYYPYSNEITDISNIPVYADSDIQTDYLYSLPVTGLNNHNANAVIDFEHALAAIRLSFSRGTYTGNGTITGISIRGNNLATEGRLDARTGVISELNGIGASISPAMTPVTINRNKYETDIMVIPSEKETVICMEITMDGEAFTVETEKTVLEKGKISVFDIKINNSTVNIESVKVRSWDYGKTFSADLGKTWNIRIDGDTDGITLSSSIEDDGSVNIIAVPPHKDAEVNPVHMEGSAIIDESVNKENGTRTIRLRDIGSDITLRFDSYSLWITATYDITDVTKATRLLDYESYPDRTQCVRMKVDGIEAEASNSYQFLSTGIHSVRFTFRNKSKIHSYSFVNNDNLKSLMIPEGVESLETYSIYNCSKLESVTLPQSLRMGETDSMSRNKSLKSLVLPDNMSMEPNFLRYCSNLETVILPRNLKKIPQNCFYACSNLKTLEIPESVTEIEKGAFNSMGLISISIPDGITRIPDEMCTSCSDIIDVELPANTSHIGSSAFQFCSKLSCVRFRGEENTSGTLSLPEGLESLGEMAFNNCDAITAVELPSSLTSIGTGALSCKKVASLTISPDNIIYEVKDGFNGIITKSTGILVQGYSNATVIPENVTQIGDYAYYQIPIQSIDIHDKVTYLGNNALARTGTLKSIISRSAIPPATGTSNVFTAPAYNGVLKVPSGAIEAYTTAWYKNAAGFLGLSSLKWSIEEIKEGE